MTDQNYNNQKNINLLDESNYLVTHAVSTSALPQNKVQTDLQALEKAEEKTEMKMNIAQKNKNPQVSRAMLALKLSNPFKGY